MRRARSLLSFIWTPLSLLLPQVFRRFGTRGKPRQLAELTHCTPIAPSVEEMKKNASDSFVLHIEGRSEDRWNDERGNLTFRSFFSADSTPTSLMTTGIAEIPMGGFLALHRHEQAETYLVLSGRGTVTLDGEAHEVRTGTSVFVPGDAEHGIRNDGVEPIRIYYVLAADSFSDVEYRFS